jgi:hypothetical protein
MGDIRKYDKFGDIRRYHVAVYVTSGHVLAAAITRESVTRTIRFHFGDDHSPGSLSRYEVQLAIQAAYAHLKEQVVGIYVAEDKEYAGVPSPKNDEEMARSLAMLERELDHAAGRGNYRKNCGPVGRPRKLHLGPERGPSNRNSYKDNDGG